MRMYVCGAIILHAVAFGVSSTRILVYPNLTLLLLLLTYIVVVGYVRLFGSDDVIPSRSRIPPQLQYFYCCCFFL